MSGFPVDLKLLTSSILILSLIFGSVFAYDRIAPRLLWEELCSTTDDMIGVAPGTMLEFSPSVLKWSARGLFLPGGYIGPRTVEAAFLPNAT